MVNLCGYVLRGGVWMHWYIWLLSWVNSVGIYGTSTTWAAQEETHR